MLKFNVLVSVLWFVLFVIVLCFFDVYLDIWLEVIVDENFVDVLVVGCDVGICYDEWFE